MSLAEFAIPSTQSKNRKSKKDEFNEIRSLIIRIQRERRRNESSPRKIKNDTYLDGNFAGDDFDSDATPNQDLDQLFRILSLGSDDSSSVSSRHEGKEKDTQTRKRVRPWTTNYSCTPSTRSNSLLWSSHSGPQELKLFHIRPEMESLIKAHKTPSSPFNSKKNKKSDDKSSLKHDFTVTRMPSNSLLCNDLEQRIQASRRLLQRPRSSLVLKLMKNSTSTVIRPQLCPSVVVTKMLQTQQRNRQLSFEIRNQRIEDAKTKRSTFRDYTVKRLEETLQRKEQHRLEHLILKKRETRQTLVITTIKLVATIHRWFYHTPDIIAKFRYMKTLNDAARKIQQKWKKEAFLRSVFEARIIRTKLKRFSLRLHIWSRCARRRLNAKIIRDFLVDFSSNILPYLIIKFRSRVIKAQQMIKNFVECKYARILSLELSWDRIEKDIVAAAATVMGKQKKRKNVLSDISHHKILMRGNGFQVGDGKSTTLTSFISDVQHQKNHSISTTIKELLPNRDPQLCRDFCRFHLEDSRRSHMERSGVRFVRQKSSINRNHAIQLLTGIESDTPYITPFVRSWSFFSLLVNEKEQLTSIIQDFRRDEIVARKKVDERRGIETLVHKANHFASSIQSSSPSNEVLVDVDDQNTEQNLLTEISVIFQLIDVNGNNKINDADIQKIRCVLGFENDPREQIIQDELDFKSFVNVLKNCSRHTKRSQHIVLGAFQYFVQGSMGTISETSLNSILQSIGDEWNTEKTARMINNIECNGKEFNYKQFISTMYAIWGCNNTSELFNI